VHRHVHRHVHPRQHSVPTNDSSAVQVGVFAVAGVFEIGGGWLVWGSIRCASPSAPCLILAVLSVLCCETCALAIVSGTRNGIDTESRIENLTSNLRNSLNRTSFFSKMQRPDTENKLYRTRGCKPSCVRECVFLFVRANPKSPILNPKPLCVIVRVSGCN